MEVNYEREIMQIEKCLNDFNANVGSLLRRSTALTDPTVAGIFGLTQIEITNLALVSHGLATRCAMLRHRLYKTAEWNEAYKAAYGVNHPDWEAQHYDDPHQR